MLERLERLLRALDTKQPLDADLSSWLGQAITRHISDGTSLDAALNIGGCRGKFLLKRRDYCLVQAWRLLERDDPTESHWERSGRLEDLLNLFHDGRWQHYQFKPEPGDMDEISRWLFRACKTGRKLIGQRSIDNLLLKNAAGSNFNQMVVDFYYHNDFYTLRMTTQKTEPKRVTPEMEDRIWQKRRALTDSWKQRAREMQMAEAKRRMMQL